MSESAHIQAARKRLWDRDHARAGHYHALWARAAADGKAIVEMIVKEYQPTRVYQWGSILRPEGFRDYSDIDIAVEGITDAETFFRMLGVGQAMTGFELDLVQIEKVAPEYAEDIRQHGKIRYERR